MNARTLLITAAVVAPFSFHVSAATHYVNGIGTNPVAPYTNWMTAATNIQDAVNSATFAETVLVTNGIYQYGGDSNGSGSNRVDAINGVVLRSVNGPAATIIQGYQVPGTTNGANAMRCVYLHEFSTLSGFTLTNGATPSAGSGGGVTMESQCVVSNCIITGNAAANNGGGAFSGNGSLLVDCVFNGNTATSGGGASGFGGALIQARNCVFSNNASAFGGGIYSGLANNCLFTGNGSTNGFGGNGTSGGAADNSTLNNCTLVGNFSKSFGAAEACILASSIIYYNHNGIYSDCYQCRLTNCCTPSLANNSGPVNTITNAPGLVDSANGNFHLQIGSPCIDAGTNAFAPSGTDLDGNPRIVGAAVDMGAFESQYTNLPELHYVSLTSTNPVAPYTNWITAATNIQDAVNVANSGEMVVADSGNYTNGGTIIYGSETNRVALTNGITLLSLNGAQMTAIVGGTQMRCVYVGSNSVLMGFTLTNGHARTLGDLTNEQSGGAAWCESGAVISNCLIIGNTAQNNGSGGGVYGGTTYNSSFLSNNAAFGGGGALGLFYNCSFISNAVAFGNFGGAVSQSTLSNCVLIRNAPFYGITGGGAYRSVLYHCTLATNFSTYGGGGADSCVLSNCVLIGNQSTFGGGGARLSTNYYCTFINNFGANGGGGVYGGVAYSCILSNTITQQGGGGAYQATLYNCILFGNRETNTGSFYYGGGAYQGTLYNCLVLSNSASAYAGGVYQGTLYNCTVIGNAATNSGGGTYGGTVYNSIVYYNSAASGSNYSGSSFAYCCTTPLANGNCFTDAPVFLNPVGGDFHQQTNSPTINGGLNGFTIVPVAITNDLDGNPRIVGGTVDVGAYEYQGSNLSVTHVPIPWLRQYGLPTDGSADYLDSDGDGMNNWQEWIAGTAPNNAASVLQMLTPASTDNSSGIIVSWQSVANVTYFLDRSSDLSAQPAFSTILSNIVGQPGTTTVTDTSATNAFPYFYRVGIQP